jgi:AP-2 complex subunit alpha
MAESLAPVVQKLLVANTSPSHVKKRAALALLRLLLSTLPPLALILTTIRLYRKYPSIITPDLWASKLVGLLDESDFGVLTAVVSLLLGLVADNSEGNEPPVLSFFLLVHTT